MAEAPGTQPGGIAGLIAFLRKFGRAVEADLRRYYDVRLSDLTTGRLTWRQLSVYLAGLPRDSATAREVGGPDIDWDLHAHLLAAAFDALQVANWQRAAKKGSKAPKPTARPGVRDKGRLGKTSMSPREARDYLARLRPKEATDGN